MHALVLALLLSVQEQQAPPTSPASIYSSWSHGPSSDPNWFPIGVWLQDPKLAARYGELGINTFVGLWQGPTREQLEQLARADMSVICSMNKVALELADSSNIIAWMLEDEPDNKKTPPKKLQAAHDRMQARDATRPIWLNLGQGVANDRWKGRRSPRAWYPEYAAAADIVSFDVYPVTNIGRDNGEDFLGIIAKGLGRLGQWTGGNKPLWNMIECTRVQHEFKKPTPEQVESEVWISLINGSRGIVYFCHNFKPRTEAAALLNDKAMSRAVAEINKRVKGYARVLNTPSIDGLVQVTSADPEAPIAVMTKHFAAFTYVFCVGMSNKSTKARITSLEPIYGSQVSEASQNRTLLWEENSFEDEFKPYEVHIYTYRHEVW